MPGCEAAPQRPPKRRRLGQYDTPDMWAEPLVRWGLRGSPGRVLDPSFGGCSFLRAALRTLAANGELRPGDLLYGIDVERPPQAAQLVELGVPPNHLIIEDFFATDAATLPPFDLIVGNPPYIRHHWFQHGNRLRAAAAVARQGVRLDGRANAWAYFLVHSGAFLRPGGRMAVLLPGAALFTDYARQALDYMRTRAARSTLVRIGTRVFPDAREETVVLLVEGWGHGPGQLAHADLGSVEGLEVWLSQPVDPMSDVAPGSAEIGSSSRVDLDGASAAAWARAVEHPSVVRLGECAAVRIGVVTGANRFFIRTFDDAHLLSAEAVRLAPIIARVAG